MAPVKKRGAIRLNLNNDLQIGDLVLAKVKGFPAWPAKICRPEDWSKSPDPKKYFVEFFGTSEIAFVAPPDIQIFTNESKSKLLARCQGKTVKYFAQAVEEICEAFEKLPKSSNELEEVSSKTAVNPLSLAVLSFKRSKSLVHNKKMPKEARVIVAEPVYDGDTLGEKTSVHLDDTHQNVADTFPVNKVDTKPTAALEQRKASTLYSETTESKLKEDTNGQATASEISLLKNEVDVDLGVQTNHIGEEKLKKLPPAGRASVPEGRIKSINEKSSEDSKKFGAPVNSVKRHDILNCSTAKKAENEIPTEGVSKEKHTTEGALVLESYLDHGDDVLVSSMKRKLVNNGDLPLAKRSKPGKGVDMLKSSNKNDLSNPHLTSNKSKNSSKKRKLEALVADNNSEPIAESHDKKACRQSGDVLNSSVSSVDAAKKSKSCVNKLTAKPLSTHVPPKKRALRYFDEDNDEGEYCRTPIHQSVGLMPTKPESSIECHLDVSLSNAVKVSDRNVSSGMKESTNNNMGFLDVADRFPSASSSCNIDEKMLESTIELLTDQISVKQEENETTSPEIRTQSSAFEALVNTETIVKSVNHKDVGPHITTNHSQKSKPSLEKSKVKSTIQMTGDTDFSLEHDTGNDMGQREVNSAADSLPEANSQHAYNENGISGGAPTPHHTRYVAKDKKWFQASTDSDCPPQQSLPVKLEQHDDYDCRPTAGCQQPETSSTESAIARDILEGMLEKLSRTRDSIVTDCAKYGFASEVMELLMRKLEDETSFYRRIDLLFLVECSLTQKGTVGSSCIPAVQAALSQWIKLMRLCLEC